MRFVIFRNYNKKPFCLVKYPEPRQLIRFPINIEEATEEDKRRIQLLRRPKQKLIVTEDTGKGFDPRKYIKF